MRTLFPTILVAISPLQCLAQFNVSAAIGADNANFRCNETASPFGTNAILSCKEHRPSSSIRLGYRWNSWLGLEYSEFDFGTAKSKTFNEGWENRLNMVVGRGSYLYSQDKLHTRARVVSMTGYTPISASTLAGLKIGWSHSKSVLEVCQVLRVDTEFNMCQTTSARAEQSLYLGAMLSYKLSESWSAMVSADYVPLGKVEQLGTTLSGYSKGGATLMTVGFRYEL